MRAAIAAVLILGGAATSRVQATSAWLVDATQPAVTTNYLRLDDYRVAVIGYRLAVSGIPLCPEQAPVTGLTLHHLAEYAPKERPAAAAEYGLDGGPGVLAVVPGSPAASAGLIAGDVLLALNGQPFAKPQLSDAKGDPLRQSIEAVETQLDEALRRGAVRLLIRRLGAEQQVTLGSAAGCPSRFRLARSTQVNAFANRGYVIVSTALLPLFQTEDELAFVIAHEIAHVVLRHPEMLAAAGVPVRGLLRGAGRNGVLVKRTEVEADWLALRLTRAAGYDPGAAIPYWRRFYARSAGGLGLFRTHPTLAERERMARAFLAAEAAGRSQPGAQRP